MIVYPHIMRLDSTLRAGEVTRYHAVPEVRPQTDGLHTWGLMVLLVHITAGDVSAELLVEALMHDTGERVAGDLPYTVKRNHPKLAEMHGLIEHEAREHDTIVSPIGLNVRETALLKICDTLEGLIWCAKYENQSRVKDADLGNCVRWSGAYEICKTKFKDQLDEDEWERADIIYRHYWRATT